MGARLDVYNRWRERYNPLRGLTVQRAVTMLEQHQRGEFADPCWAYYFVECTDADLFALVERRESALLELPWHISPMSAKWRKDDSRAAKFDQGLADEQIAALGESYNAIDNLYAALAHMGSASFRGFAHLEKYRRADGSIRHLECVDQWNMVRDLLKGPWKYNPAANATTYAALPGENAVDPAEWVIREERRHVDRLGLIKFIRASLSEKDWDAFIEIYGIPNGVVIGPPNVPEGKENEYKSSAKDIAEGGSGYLPHGSEYIPNSGPRGVNPFRPRLDYLTEKLILAGTGGLLTMLTQSGSGTLAGDAHTETFEKIARAEARKISQLFAASIDADILGRLFPGKPTLAYFELAANDELDPDKIVDHASKLSLAGWRIDTAQLEEKTGYKLVEIPPAAPSAPSVAGDGIDALLKNRETPAARGDSQPDSPVLGKLLARSRMLFGEALADDLRPLRDAFAHVLSAEDGELLARVQALYDALPGLGEQIIAANGATDALERILGSAAANGLQSSAGKPGRIANTDRDYVRDGDGQFAEVPGGGSEGDGHSQKPPERISIEEADRLLTTGHSERDGESNAIHFGIRLKDHLEKDHSANEAAGRKKLLKWGFETVRGGKAVKAIDPKTGREHSYYAKFFQDGGKEKGFLCIVDTADGEAFSIFRTPRHYLKSKGIINREAEEMDDPGEQPPVTVLQALAAAGLLKDCLEPTPPRQKVK